MNPIPRLRLAIPRWLLLVAPVAVGGTGCIFGNCPVHGERVITLREAQAQQADGGASDGGVALAGMTTVTQDNCAEVCRVVLQASGFAAFQSCTPTSSDAGEPAADCRFTQPCEGRAPAGLASTGRVDAPSDVAAYLARAAHFEAASIHAFARLGAELAAHGAPASLVRAAARAAGDEVRHAQAMARLARAHGAAPAAPEIAPPAARSLEAMLVENAVEGCVGETYGAALASLQARTARLPEVREALHAIARDEVFHAELAWSVARWGERRLDADANARVRAARDGAVGALVAGARREAAPRASREALGLPDAEQAGALLAQMRRELWQA